jgi:hypothetical protein
MIFTMCAVLAFGTGAALAENPIIQVIHNSPSTDAAVVDVYLNDGLAIDDLGFRMATGLVSLEAGMYTIGIAPGDSEGPEDIIATFGPVELAMDTKTVVMAAGELGTDFNLFFNELATEAMAGQVGILAFHGAPDAPAVDVAAVDVGVLFAALDYLAFQGYLEVPEGDYVLTVAPTGDDPIAAFQAPLTGLGGGTAVVFASGYLGMDPAFGLFAALNDGTVIELPPTTVSSEDASWSDVRSMYR